MRIIKKKKKNYFPVKTDLTYAVGGFRALIFEKSRTEKYRNPLVANEDYILCLKKP